MVEQLQNVQGHSCNLGKKGRSLNLLPNKLRLWTVVPFVSRFLHQTFPGSIQQGLDGAREAVLCGNSAPAMGQIASLINKSFLIKPQRDVKGHFSRHPKGGGCHTPMGKPKYFVVNSSLALWKSSPLFFIIPLPDLLSSR